MLVAVLVVVIHPLATLLEAMAVAVVHKEQAAAEEQALQVKLELHPKMAEMVEVE